MQTMLDIFSEHHLAAIVGLVGGVLLGLAARLGRFCTLGAIEDWLYGGSDIRMRMWGVAIGGAVLGVFTLMQAGWFDPAQSHYLATRWRPQASIAGGLVFGYGMALAGNCGYGAIARLGGGDLRSFVIVLVMGVSTYVVMSGPLAPLRVALFPEAALTNGPPPGAAHGLAAWTGLPVAPLGMAAGLTILVLSLRSRALWARPGQIGWALAVSLAALTAWAGTTALARAGFEGLPVVSHSFAAPLGESILWWMTGSAWPVSFAVGSVAGVWTGAFIGSLVRGHFRWEACEDPRELRRQIIGAALMGAGAVVAMGCSVGQGLSAFSVLAWSAPVTALSILAGAALGLRQLIVGFAPAA